ncbi:SDR family NAD(P)-dependent oxidoreductase [Sphaerisporangium corydalis]|uniref:SDR family NAD(P)-dependent oxidoreductase n=1 Tax=Sphaerisporangium corydalis TaxID=1441875 RepID=A0ABV9EH91_9ACTN|nr:SDR family NAD(P)-dependent oxidoreductase [Sphaerisporangium corydalis]
MSIDLTGKNALVTGGTRGIGRAVAHTLARAGASVTACYRSDEEAAAVLARELKEIGGDHTVVRADVSSPEDVAQLMEHCHARGGLDVVVNNAGVIGDQTLEELTLDEWHRVVTNDLTAVYLVVRGALGLLTEGASVVTIGSAAALRGLPGRSHYTAAKSGLIGFSRTLAKELGPKGIRVNVVAPGVIDTDEPPGQPSEQQRRLGSLIALRRLGRPDEVADVVLFLASDLARYVTGETVTVDGGF